MRKLITITLLLCAAIVFAAPQSPAKVGIKVIAEKSPAPKGSIDFAIMPDSYIEESKEVKYEEYGITWLYTTAKVDVFKTVSEVKAYYKIRGTYKETSFDTGDVILTSGNRADFSTITISPRSNFCLMTLEHVRPTPEALKQLETVTVKPEKKPIAKPITVTRKKPIATFRHARHRPSKNTHSGKNNINTKTQKKEPVRTVRPDIKVTDIKPIPVDIIKEAPPANKNITPVKKPVSKLPNSIKKVIPKSTKPKSTEKKSEPFFEG
jgi:hypothetical protein